MSIFQSQRSRKSCTNAIISCSIFRGTVTLMIEKWSSQGLAITAFAAPCSKQTKSPTCTGFADIGVVHIVLRLRGPVIFLEMILSTSYLLSSSLTFNEATLPIMHPLPSIIAITVPGQVSTVTSRPSRNTTSCLKRISQDSF